MKIVRAPSEPVHTLHRFTVTGVATPDDAGKPLVVSIDGDFKLTGPLIAKDGSWRLDLVFPRPGDRRLSVSVGDQRAECLVRVVGEGNEATLTGSPVASVPAVPPLIVAPPPPPAAASSGVVARLLPGAPTLYQLVEEAHNNNYSDIHIGVGRAPRFRSRGQIEPTAYPITDLGTFNAWLKEILTDPQIEFFYRELDFDGASQYPFARVRINLFQTLHGPAMVLRLIPLTIKTFEQLALPDTFADLCHAQKGLILITGPTGSGKSTTLAAMVDYINRSMNRHIITIEDPIEFVHQSLKSVINQREVGMHSLEFASALRASLREDPDVILIGEMRDRETIETALKAAQTGHLVFGTLHTNSAVKTLERILAMYNPDERSPMLTQMAEGLLGVVAQGLIPTTDGKRAPFYEVLRVTDAVRDYIKKDAIDEVENLIPRSRYEGMCTMNQILYQLYLEGRINQDLALEYSPRANEMAIIMRTGDVDGAYE